MLKLILMEEVMKEIRVKNGTEEGKKEGGNMKMRKYAGKQGSVEGRMKEYKKRRMK